MKIYGKIPVVLIGLLFAGGSFYGFDFARAQQLPVNPVVQKNASPPAPAPTVAPLPKTSPTPEIVEEDNEVVKIDTELVNILFTAQDKDRRLLTSLKKDDVRILEDGQPQEIFTFMRQVDLPLSIAILIDTSGSQERTLPEEKAGATAFINDVVRPNKDEVAVLTFTGETTLEQSLTGNTSRLTRAVERIKFVPPSGYLGGGVVAGGTPPISGTNQSIAGGTAVWDSVYVASKEVLGESPQGTRRAIILLTDGVDYNSRLKLDEAVSQANKNEVTVYAIGIGDEFVDGVNENVLKKITERTGGRAYFPRDESELRRAFTQIQIEMRSQYLVAYEPTNPKRDGSYRKIEIQLTNPELNKQKIRITHRQGYFAKTEAKKK